MNGLVSYCSSQLNTVLYLNLLLLCWLWFTGKLILHHSRPPLICMHTYTLAHSRRQMKILLFLTSINLYCSQRSTRRHQPALPLSTSLHSCTCVCAHFDTCVQANHLWQQLQIISRLRVAFTQALPSNRANKHSCLSLEMSAYKFCIYMLRQSRWVSPSLWGLPLL